MKLFQMYYGLNKLAIKNIYGKNDYIEKALKISPSVSIELIYAMFNKNEETVRHAMLKGISKFCQRQGYDVNTKILKSLYLGLSAIVSSDKVDFLSLAKNSIYDFPAKKLKLLHRASLADKTAIAFICDNLRIGENSVVLREISGMF